MKAKTSVKAAGKKQTGAAHKKTASGVKKSAQSAEKMSLTPHAELKHLEQALRDSQSKFRNLVERLPQAIYTSEIGVNGIWEYVSPQIENLLGVPAQEWLADPTNWERHVHPDDLAAQLTLEQDAFAKGEPFEGEYRMFRRDGREIWVRDVGHIHARDDGRRPIVEGLLMDISERRRIEQAARESEGRYRNLVDGMLDGVYLSSHAGKFVEVNPAMLRMFGYTNREEMLSLDIKKDLYFSPIERESLFLDTGQEKVDEFRMKRKDGSEIWVEDHGKYVHDEQGNVIYHEGILRDITDRKQAEHIQSILLQISNAAIQKIDLDELYRTIHQSLRSVMLADNFFIAQYDSASGLLNFPYYVDEYDEPPGPAPLGRGLTEYVLLQGEPLLGRPGAIQMLEETGAVESVGTRSIDWLGVPLKVNHESKGVMAVQSYRENVRYGQRELDILSFVSSQVALAIERKQADEKLRQSENKYRALTEQVPAVIYTDSFDSGETLYISPNVNTLLGYSADEWLAQPGLCNDIIHPEDCQRVSNQDEVARQTERFALDYRYIREDGRVVWVHDEAVLLKDQSGEPKYWQGVMLDITAQRLAEEALRASEERYRLLLESLSDAVYVLNQDWRYIIVNDAAATFVNMTREQLLGKRLFDLFPDLEETSFFKTMRRVMETRKPESVISDYTLADLGRRWYELRIYPARDGIVCISTNITESKQAEQALRESQDRLSLFFNQSLDGFFFSMLDEPMEWNNSVNKEAVLDYVMTHQRITEVNSAMLQQYGASSENFLGRTVSDFYAHDFEQGRRFRRQLFDQGHLRMETDERKDDGTPISIEGDYVCMYDPAGRITGIFGIQRDVTERRQAESALLQFRSVLDQSRDAIFMIDPRTSRYLDFNQQAHSFLDYTAEELRGLKVIQIAQHIPNMDMWQERVRLIRQNNGLTFETAYMRKDGTTFPVEVSARMLEYSGQEIMLAIVRDITERKKAEAQIREHVQHLTSLQTIDAVINASFDLGIISDVLLEQIISQLRVDAADLLILNHESLILYYHAGRGFQSHLARDRAVRLGEGVAGMVAMERRSARISNITDLHADKDFGAFWQSEELKDYVAIPLVAKGQVKGILEVFHRQPLELDSALTDFLETLASQAAIAIDNAQLFERLQRTNLDLSMAYDATIEGWSRAMDLRDHVTEGHAQRVTNLTLDLARFMGVPDTDLIHIYRGALLHDIGKMSTPDSILFKPGQLSPEELEIMRQHPLHAFNMLAPIAYLRPALDIPYCHHEKWDGSGYPRGLLGVEIPLAARIFAITDVWDALLSDRPYRVGWTETEAKKYIKEQSGKYFDPAVVEAFIKMLATRSAGNRNTR